MGLQFKICSDVVRVIPHSFTRLLLSVIFTAALASSLTPTYSSDHLVNDEAKLISDNIYLESLENIVNNVDVDSSDNSKFNYKEIAALKEYGGFSPLSLMTHLAGSAARNTTSPREFRQDIRELVESYQKYGCKHSLERITNLERKYNIIRVLPNTRIYSDTITCSRLVLMFPHYHDFQGDVSIIYGYGNFCPLVSRLVPKIMQHPEFGGLIPRQGEGLSDSVRESIIRVHLYALTCGDGDFHTKMALLEKRIENSLLSDKNRIRLLQRSSVLLEDGQINKAFFKIFNIFPDQNL